MKSLNEFLEKIVKKTVEKSLKRDANNTTCIAVYQPKVPTNLKKFSRINKE